MTSAARRTNTEANPIMTLSGLRVAFGQDPAVVNGISFELRAGECLAIVGESGSGKSLTARALLGLLPEGATMSADELAINGMSMLHATSAQWQRVRGNHLGLVSQDALVSLDPLRRVRDEVAEAIEIHEPGLGKTQRSARVIDHLERVAFPAADRAGARPHELSGGQRQRALIASALSADPGILIADEPTTALDVTVQARILELLRTIKSSGVGILLISHDLSVVARLADRVMVMRAGAVCESGPTRQVLNDPQHEYTRALIAAAPRAISASSAPPADSPSTQAPVVLAARGLSQRYAVRGGREVVALNATDIAVVEGETVGIVGESGSGKSTLARLLLAFETPRTGEVVLGGGQWSSLPERRRRQQRTEIQLISQDPASSLDPRLTVARTIGQALRRRDRVHTRPAGAPSLSSRITQALAEVGLSAEIGSRRPQHLSGGQRQRVAIARALAVDPTILVCDEATSALDVIVQSRIVELLKSVRASRSLSIVFISHDLDLVAELSDRVLVMQGGTVVEEGSPYDIFVRPQHEFTRALVAASSVSS